MDKKKLISKLGLGKLSPISIIRNHYKTLHKFNNNPHYFEIYGWFLIIPLIISITTFYFVRCFNDNMTIALLTALSIIMAIFLNFLVLLISSKKDIILENTKFKESKKNYLIEFKDNIIFAIFTSLIGIILLVVYQLGDFSNNIIIRSILVCTIYFILTIFLFTLLLILNRINKLAEAILKQ